MLRTNFGFRYAEPTDALMAIRTIGWESAVSGSYRWNGRTRGDKFALFQYTLSGEGNLTIGGKHYRIPKHHGFFVTVPDNHEYYYSPDAGGEPWEFIFLTAAGRHVEGYWNDIVAKAGPVVSFKPNAQPIAMLWEMMESAQAKTGLDKYELSVRLYEWIVACLRAVDGRPDAGRPVPDSVAAALKFMDAQYHRFLTLEQIAAEAGMSKYHFCRLFLKHTGITPIHYLTKIRIEQASRLLRQTDQPIGAIAAATGFDNGSYFGKVFRKLMDASPQQFRDSTDDIPEHHIFID
ncbi:AraC family transcriptional regulator [Cohnella rhizosphaerae]|uniref:AraC family transcriptional regulator n=1 Tax=Cohnella rhizosphaerae TaxID=1457232 RepID=A0A9X4KTD5_9BACL|nr:AraC family transcriptional regulator [Cohnella rhizosphaerae]MDG0809896.1 AraC family transcriptional regulator [Cohnella rhizosphaerae]